MTTPLDYDPFPEPLSITKIRADHVAHVIPEAIDDDAVFRFMGMHLDRAPLSAMTMRVKADGTVTTCPCHEVVINGDLILGLRWADPAPVMV